VLYYLNHAFIPFCFSYFFNRILHFCLGRPGFDLGPPIYTSFRARMMNASLRPALLIEIGSC
jgi:hypothetical protein